MLHLPKHLPRFEADGQRRFRPGVQGQFVVPALLVLDNLVSDDGLNPGPQP